MHQIPVLLAYVIFIFVKSHFNASLICISKHLSQSLILFLPIKRIFLAICTIYEANIQLVKYTHVINKRDLT